MNNASFQIFKSIKLFCAVMIISLFFFVPLANAVPLSYDEAIDGDINGNGFSSQFPTFNLDIGTNVISGSRSQDTTSNDQDDFRFTVPKNTIVTNIKFYYNNVTVSGAKSFTDTRFLQSAEFGSSSTSDGTIVFNTAGSVDPNPNELFTTILPIGFGTHLLTDGAKIGVPTESFSMTWDYRLEITVVDVSTDRIVTTGTALTDSSLSGYTPVLGQDATSKIVVYSDYPSTGGNHSIYYQRLNVDGSFSGTPIKIASDLTHNLHPDISGKYIVYTARDNYQVSTGKIMLYNLETDLTTVLHATDLSVSQARINGNHVVWSLHYGGSESYILYYNTAWLGTNTEPLIIAGPLPASMSPEIGERYITWTEKTSLTGRILVAYEIATGSYFIVEEDSAYANQNSTTKGAWVFYEQITYDRGSVSSMNVKGVNMLTAETRDVSGQSFFSYQPSFDGEYVAYSSKGETGASADANLDIFIYRLSDGQRFQITDLPGHQYQGDVYGNDIAYVDSSSGNYVIKVAHFEIIPGNIMPIADAGADQGVLIGSVVMLDGSASSDPDNNYALTYSWTITSKPAGSWAMFTYANVSSVSPTFIADTAGNYDISLTVTDSLGLSSTSDSITVSTINTAPIADAGANQAVTTLNTLVTLDGSQSYDLEGDPLTYSWELVGKPVGSTAVLSDISSITPTFVADIQGTYTAELTVNDSWINSTVATVTVSFANIAPVADAGVNQSVSVGDTVILNGSASDINNDTLTYKWAFVSTPTGSLAELSGATSASVSFVANVAGTYVVSLVVNDGLEDSAPHNVNVIATTTQTSLVDSTNQTITNINTLNPTVLKNKNMGNTLTNKLLNVLDLIEQGLYLEALDKLNNDILRKTDGCANDGSPDRNDWIRSCPEQALVYDSVMETIVLLEALI